MVSSWLYAEALVNWQHQTKKKHQRHSSAQHTTNTRPSKHAVHVPYPSVQPYDGQPTSTTKYSKECPHAFAGNTDKATHTFSKHTRTCSNKRLENIHAETKHWRLPAEQTHPQKPTVLCPSLSCAPFKAAPGDAGTCIHRYIHTERHASTLGASRHPAPSPVCLHPSSSCAIRNTGTKPLQQKSFTTESVLHSLLPLLQQPLSARTHTKP